MVMKNDFLRVETIIWSLADDTSESALNCVRVISSNILTPAYVLRRLALSPNPELKIAVAEHLNTPTEVLLLLAEDDSPDVRYAIAENHNIAREVLDKLCTDANPYVASRAERTVSRLESRRPSWSSLSRSA